MPSVSYTHLTLPTNREACIVGGDEGRQRAKKTLPWVAIGAVLIVGAMEIAKYVIGQIAF